MKKKFYGKRKNTKIPGEIYRRGRGRIVPLIKKEGDLIIRVYPSGNALGCNDLRWWSSKRLSNET